MSADGFVGYAKTQYGVIVTLEEATVYRTHYFERFPELNEHYASIARDMKYLKYIGSPLGRRKRKPKDHKKDNMLSHINAKIQGFGSDVLILAMLEVSEMPEHKKDFRIMGTVHDSILISLKKDKLATLDKIVSIMEHPKYMEDMMDEPFKVPLKADYTVFKDRWYGEKVNYEIGE